MGLTTSLFLSEYHTVYGYDIDIEKLKIIKQRKMPFYEKGFEKLLKKNYNKTFCVVNLEELTDFSDYIFICLPIKTENVEEDISYLKHTIELILNFNKKYKIIIIKSTILPGTCRRLKEELYQYNFDLISNPEFLTEGTAIVDLFSPGKIVLGGTKEVIQKVASIYKSCFTKSPNNIIETNWETAEFIKYLSNCMLATMISFSNEMADVAEKLENIDIRTAFSTLHLDPRFNDGSIKNWIYPGCGYGGWCLPKDTKALATYMSSKMCDMKILEAVINENIYTLRRFIDKILLTVAFTNIKYIGILGLSFKTGTADVRESIASKIVNALYTFPYQIIAYDPLAMLEFKKLFPNIQYALSVEDLIKKSDLIVVTNKDEQYKIVKNSKKPYIDGRYFI